MSAIASQNKMKNAVQNSLIKMIEKHSKIESRPSSVENLRQSHNLDIDKELVNRKTENSAHTMSSHSMSSYGSEDEDDVNKIQ